MELDSKSLNKKILREVQSFSGSDIRDDMSLMTIKIKATGQKKNQR
jgi:serine phosphatase RsbU (regulator of sigma subunit)